MPIVFFLYMIFGVGVSLYAAQDASAGALRGKQFAQAREIVAQWDIYAAVKSLEEHIKRYPYYKQFLPNNAASYVKKPICCADRSGEEYSVSQIARVTVPQRSDYSVNAIMEHNLQPVILSHEEHHFKESDPHKQYLFDAYDMPRHTRYTRYAGLCSGVLNFFPLLLRRYRSVDALARCMQRGVSMSIGTNIGGYGYTLSYRAQFHRSIELNADSNIPADTPEQVIAAVKLFALYVLRDNKSSLRKQWSMVSPWRFEDEPEKRLEHYLDRVPRSILNNTKVLEAIASITESVASDLEPLLSPKDRVGLAAKCVRVNELCKAIVLQKDRL